MALEALDNSAANGFKFAFDGIELTSVTEISSLKVEVEKIDLKVQTPDGKYVPRQVCGRGKCGSFQVTQGITQNKSVHEWLKRAQDGDPATARTTASIELLDYKGEPVKTYEFENCWVGSLETNSLKAGAAEQATHKFTVYFDSATIS